MRRITLYAVCGMWPLVAGSWAAPASQPASVPAAVAPTAFEMMAPAVPVPLNVTRADGYAGQWYSPSRGPTMRMGFGGGLAFFPMGSQPVAVYAPTADKTFFVYAGTPAPGDQLTDNQPLQVAISYYDHKTGTVPHPVVLLNGSAGAYGCPALTIDATGRLYVFSAMLGTELPGQIVRSVRPYDISAWEKIGEMAFRSPQAWFVPGQGFMLLHTRLVNEQPSVFFSISPDGLAWSKPVRLATFGVVDACVSGQFRNKVGVGLGSRPGGTPPTGRSGLYYLETSDLGKTWQAYPRLTFALPLKTEDNGAKAYDYGSDWSLFLRNLVFSPMGYPIILQVVRQSSTVEPVRQSRLWTVTRWVGRGWESAATLSSDSDFDGGDLAADRLALYLAAATIPGPQPETAGGDMVRWKSLDQGRSWYPERLTHDSPVNQNWSRHPVNAVAAVDFLWADGNALKPSPSRIYFADRAGNTYVLPTLMKADTAKPELLWAAPPPPPEPKPASTDMGSATAPAK